MLEERTDACWVNGIPLAPPSPGRAREDFPGDCFAPCFLGYAEEWPAARSAPAGCPFFPRDGPCPCCFLGFPSRVWVSQLLYHAAVESFPVALPAVSQQLVPGGAGAYPLLLLSKGFLLGLGTLVLLEAEPLWGPAVWFAPAAAGSCLILLLYGLSAFRFSCRLLRACRSPEGAPLCLRRQCKDLLLFLGLGAGISLTGAGVCFLWDVLI